ncbi:MAG TPA: FecR family protein, partial [Elusimicrobiales bacterium]|nr:FecR family protein [Elusimicrobiales bacterium]
PPAPAAAAGKVNAIVVFVKGDVQVKRAGAQDYEQVTLNDLLYAGDEIKTGEGGQASLATKGGAEVRLNQNSTFNIEASGKVREMLRLKVGQLWTRMLHKMAKLDVRTPSAVCAIRGTEADIEQRSLLTVKVYEGHVDVINAKGKQSLLAGQMSTVGSGGAPEAARQMSASDKGEWQEGMSVQDMQGFLDRLQAEGGDKKLKLKVDKDGKSKDIEIKLKKK